MVWVAQGFREHRTEGRGTWVRLPLCLYRLKSNNVFYIFLSFREIITCFHNADEMQNRNITIIIIIIKKKKRKQLILFLHGRIINTHSLRKEILLFFCSSFEARSFKCCYVLTHWRFTSRFTSNIFFFFSCLIVANAF